MLLTKTDQPELDLYFSLAAIGFTAAELILIASVCKLSRARTGDQGFYRFELVDGDSDQVPDILLAKADTADQAVIDECATICPPSTDLILALSDAQTNTPQGIYTLERKRLGGTLLLQLDAVACDRSERQPTPIPKVEVSNKSCLVIDDSQLVHTQMELILSEFGVTADFTENAETGLSQAQVHAYKLVFLDVMLPEMDGYKACKLLKADPKTSATPVIMLTSKRSPFNRMHGSLVGCDKYLTKPVDAAAVFQVLQQYALTGIAPVADSRPVSSSA